jgi:spore maturation protein CgeB
MTRKKHKEIRRDNATNHPRIVFIRHVHCTVSPACVRSLEAIGCKVEQVVVEDYGVGGVRLVEPESWEAVILRIVRLRPSAIILINSKGMDDEALWLSVAELFRIPVFDWFTDHPRFCPLQPVEKLSEALHLVLWDKGYLEEMRAFGYRHVHALPLAADPDAPRRLPAKSLEPPCDVAFVGSLADHRIAALRLELKELCERCGKPTFDETERLIAEGHQWAEANTGKSIFAFADSISPERLPADATDAGAATRLIAAIVDFELMREDRLRLARLLRDKGLQIWGDVAWQKELNAGQYRGFVEYDQVGRVYRDAKIVINLSRGQLLETVNQRVFDVPMCGGFLITDERPGLSDFVEPNADMAVFRSMEELPALVNRYLPDEEARREMSARAQRRIAEKHTYRHRMETLLELAAAANRSFADTPAAPLDTEWERRLFRVVQALWAANAQDACFAIVAEVERRGHGSPHGLFAMAFVDLLCHPKNLDQGETRLFEVCRSTTEMPHPRDLLARLLRIKKRLRDIEPIILAVEEDARESNDWKWLGISYMERGLRREAVQALDRAVELNPKSREALEALESLTTNRSARR